ncbi:hypothetical protein HF086_016802 [Spodoptera exigua]|uniref:Uncharacterized protein n=1 Tax=Spodoptera exigua TaxID=7107 RepID=A0A922SHF1_SPOEX|nr:hypothetical protein HF086_016802 [Spodoptera exigua]
MVNETNKVISSITEDLSCPEHEEADTKIVYHACKINYEANIIIRTIDTDVAAIMLGHMHRLNDESQVWMLTGTGNNLRYVNLTKIYEKLGESICRSLPGLHAITGLNNGWILENDEYHFKWFEGDQLPNYVSESLKTVSEAGEEDDVDNDEFREWSSSDDENENVNINDDNEKDF